jgi:hypothetical protein
MQVDARFQAVAESGASVYGPCAGTEDWVKRRLLDTIRGRWNQAAQAGSAPGAEIRSAGAVVAFTFRGASAAAQRVGWPDSLLERICREVGQAGGCKCGVEATRSFFHTRRRGAACL